MIPNTPFVGRLNAKRQIRSKLSSTWEAMTFNIIGAYGSGKTAFAQYIKQQIETSAWPLISQSAGNPKVIAISGKNFGKQKEMFIDFLYGNLQPYLGLTNIEELKADNIPLYTQLRNQLLNISFNKHPLIIIIDDFDRIMTHIDLSEIPNLNSLLVAGVHYIFMTDHRDLREIDPGKYVSSPFFQAAIPVPLLPLNSESAGELVVGVCNQEVANIRGELGSQNDDFLLTNHDMDLIQKLAGGNAGLLVSVTKLLCYEKFRETLEGNASDKLDEEAKFSILLNKVIEDGSVKEILNNIVKTLEELSSDLRNFLLSVAVQDRGKKSKINQREEIGAYRNKLVVMGLINEDFSQGDCIPSELIRFTILQSLIDKPFSGIEDALLKQLRLRSPDLVSFETIERELGAYMRDSDDETRKRLINSTILRLRNKIATSTNPKAFYIENIRGEGFRLKSLVTLDAFFKKGSIAFVS